MGTRRGGRYIEDAALDHVIEEAMANVAKVAEILGPLVADLDGRMLVHERLGHLIGMLEADPPAINKIQTLQELGFLSDHSQSEELKDFHESVLYAIEETMIPGWE